MDSPKFDGLFTALIMFGIIIGALTWGCWELIDYFLIDDYVGIIKTSKPIIPEIELTVKNNIIDTIYIYKNE